MTDEQLEICCALRYELHGGEFVEGLADDERESLYAARYALGRRTYIVSFMCGRIRKHVTEGRLSPNVIGMIIRDIDREEKYASLGDQCDADNWKELRAWLKEKLQELN